MIPLLDMPSSLLGPYSYVVAVAMVLYWNGTPLLSYAALLLSWNMRVAEVYIGVKVATWLFARVIGIRSHGRLSHTFFIEEYECPELAQDMTLLTLFAGGELEKWTSAVMTRVVLYLCAEWLSARMQVWPRSSLRTRVGVTAAAVVGVVCCALQWAYYVTLPLNEHANMSAADQLLWHVCIVHAVAVGVQCAGIVCTAVLHTVVYPVLSRIGERWCSGASWLDDTVADPLSDEYAVYTQFAHAFIVFAVSWWYMPTSAPRVVQVMVLMHLHLFLASGMALFDQRALLHMFTNVTATPMQTCAICLDSFRADEVVKRLPCGHVFHGRCICRWLTRTHSCPLCRRVAFQPTHTTVVFESILHMRVRNLNAAADVPAAPIVAAPPPAPPAPPPPPRPVAAPASPVNSNDDGDNALHMQQTPLLHGTASRTHATHAAADTTATTVAAAATTATAAHAATHTPPPQCLSRATTLSGSASVHVATAATTTALSLLSAAQMTQLHGVEERLCNARAQRAAAQQRLRRLITQQSASASCVRTTLTNDTTASWPPSLPSSSSSSPSAPLPSPDLFTDDPLLAASSSPITAATAATSRLHKRARDHTAHKRNVGDKDDDESDADVGRERALPRQRRDDGDGASDTLRDAAM